MLDCENDREKILNMRKLKSEGVIEFESSVEAFVKYWKRFDTLTTSI